MIRVAFALFLFIHGLAHLVGFVVPWRIAALDQMPYRTTVLAGAVNIGDAGIRVVGIIWFGIALTFAGCGIGFITRQPWALRLTMWTTGISLAMCLIGWPDARTGVFVNLIIVAVLLVMPKDTSLSVRATRDEQTHPLPSDDLIANPIASLTHAITIRSSPRDVWPWIAQMGAGNRAGWYSYDFLDNGWQRSASHIVPELQNLKIGMVFPALPGATDGFFLVSFEPEHFLVLAWKAPDAALLVTWTFVLEPLDDGFTRLIVRARGGRAYQFHGLPWPVAKHIIPIVHFIMQRKQLLGIAQRAATNPLNPFRDPVGQRT
jgi:hypothetical protein